MGSVEIGMLQLTLVSRQRHKNEQFVIHRILLLHPQLIALQRQSGVSFKAR